MNVQKVTTRGVTGEALAVDAQLSDAALDQVSGGGLVAEAAKWALKKLAATAAGNYAKGKAQEGAAAVKELGKALAKRTEDIARAAGNPPR